MTPSFRQVESKGSSSPPSLSILGTLVSSFGAEYAASAVLQLIYTLISFVSPQIVDLLIA